MTVQQFTAAKLKRLLIEHDDGVLKSGSHQKDGRDFCAMEFIAKVAGEPWTDTPECVHPSLSAYCRAMNDARWPSDDERTKGMLPLLANVFGTRDLKINIANIAEQTIRQIVPIALEHAASIHPDDKHKAALLDAAKRCKNDPAARAASDAARAASYAASDAARIKIYKKSIAIVIAEIKRAKKETP